MPLLRAAEQAESFENAGRPRWHELRCAPPVIRFAVALVLLTPLTASAFECTIKPPACQAAWTGHAVFTALVTSSVMTDPPSDGSPQAMIRTRLTVLEPFVNMDRRELALEWPLSSLSYMFKAGEQYLVYADELDGRLLVSGCSRTRRIAEAKEDLEYLRSLSTRAPVGRVFGRVTVQSQHPTEPDEVEYRPMADLPVSVSGVGFLRDVRTDESGRYEVTNVPVGPVDIEVGTSLPRSPETGDWRILDPRGCVAADFVLSPVAPGARRDVGTLRLKTPAP